MKLKYSQNLLNFKLKGPVKKFVDRAFMPSDTGDITKNAMLTNIELGHFNTNGDLLKYNHQHFIFNNYELKEIYDYNELGYCVKCVKTFIEEQKPKIIENCNINYDINNKMLEMIISKSNESNINKTIIRFNNIGNAYEYKFYKNNKFISRTYFRYSDNNKLIEKEVHQDGNYTLTKYISNNNGHPIKEVSFLNYIKQYEKTYKYDSFENVILIDETKFIYEANTEIKPEKNIEYDEFMNDLPYKTTVSLTEFIYEYDNYGNWIKQIQIDNYIETFITVRKIIYF